MDFNTYDYTVPRFFVSLHFRTTADFTIFISRNFGCNRKKIIFVFQHVCASFLFVWVIVCVCVRVRLSVSLRVIFWMISLSFISDDKLIYVWMDVCFCMYVVGTDVCVCVYVCMWMYGGINVCLCVFVCVGAWWRKRINKWAFGCITFLVRYSIKSNFIKCDYKCEWDIQDQLLRLLKN